MTKHTTTPSDTPKRLDFGIDRGHPTAWGARGILKYKSTVELLGDRQSHRGTRFKELAEKLNAGLLDAALEAGKELYPREDAGDVELYRGSGVVIVGNPRASCGYLYMGAWFEDEE